MPENKVIQILIRADILKQCSSSNLSNQLAKLQIIEEQLTNFLTKNDFELSSNFLRIKFVQFELKIVTNNEVKLKEITELVDKAQELAIEPLVAFCNRLLVLKDKHKDIV